MSTAAVENPAPLAGDSKSARKKKAKAESAAAVNVPAIPNGSGNDGSSADGIKGDSDGSHEHPYIRELSKQIRNINKKLLGTQKIDSILAENPGISLDDLVATKKINADQKASVLKKPHLKEQLEMLEGQIQHFRQFEADVQGRLAKQKEDISAQHQVVLDKIKEDAKLEATTAGAAELRRKLLVFSQFLRCAAHKRSVEDDAETDENRAFEGALLLVYGGDQKAVETAINIIEGSTLQVPTIEGIELPVKYSQIKQASIDHAPYQAEETWVDQVAEATAASETVPAGSDPTITHAGLTELDPRHHDGNAADGSLSIQPTDAVDASGNKAGERWDPAAAGGNPTNLEDSYEMIPRPQDEVDVHTSAPLAGATEGKTSWADELPVYESAGASGNQAGERWDLKVPGEQAGDDVPAETATRSLGGVDAEGSSEAPVDGDGFHPVAGRQRGGRGGRGGEFRGRGRGRGGLRGDGEFRGRGRGGFRGQRGDGEFRGQRGGGEFRGHRGDGEFRGRGRGRGGPRGGAAQAAATAAAATSAPSA